MRGHHPTAEPAPAPSHSGWRAFRLVILAVTIAPGVAETATAGENVNLSAGRIRHWDEGPVRWAILDGKAAILGGPEVIRGDRAVARVTELEHGRALEIYAEGGESGLGRRWSITTDGDVHLNEYRRVGKSNASRADAEDSALLERAFPKRGQPPDRQIDRHYTVRQDPADTPVSDFPNVPRIDPLDDLPGGRTPPTTLEPLPEGGFEREPLVVPESAVPNPDLLPTNPGTMRVVNIFLRKNTPNARIWRLRRTEDGTDIFEVTGGLTVIAEAFGRYGTIDASADNAIIWTRVGGGGDAERNGGDSLQLAQDVDQPLEIYLEGNVVFRQDKRLEAGHGDEQLIEAKQFYMDLRRQRFEALDGEINQYVADFIAPMRTTGDRIKMFREEFRGPDGKPIFGPDLIQADRTMTTGSRFPNPGYQFRSRSVDLTELRPEPLRNPLTGAPLGDEDDPNTPRGRRYQIEGRQNVFFMGPVPIFYWPRFVTTSDDIDPPLKRITFRANNVFGQQVLSDWSGFKLLGLKRPKWVEEWNLDLDYMSYRGVAGGTEFGYFGRDLSKDVLGVDLLPGIRGSYFGYIDVWGLRDHGIDILGPGPAILNNTPPTNVTYFRDAVPPLQDFRGRIISRHMQSLNAVDADPLGDTRLQIEFAYLSDRNFLEEYYKRLFDTGQDQNTLLYFLRQRENRAFTFLTQPNLQNFYTEAQSLPRADYYRLGDSFLGNIISYSQHSGINYTNTHPAIEVNNPNVFAFLPYDPVTNTSSPFTTLRGFTTHEVDVPISLGFMRITPYAQGQLVGWTNQIDYQSMGRAWGAVGGKLNLFAWKAFPEIESELFNVHGIAHKMTFDVDFRSAYSNMPLSRIGLTDNIDDNTYEYVRRYFAMTQYVGALLPLQYDPRYLALRRTISPITGTTDIQDTIQTARFEMHQRWQTKRGPEGRRRVSDWINLDVSTTYFPNARRDNFGTPWGQTMYNLEVFLGERTNFVSTGWFENFDIVGRPLLQSANSPYSSGINVINAGFQINRPPRGSMYFGYYIINSGVINTSALNASYALWLSPKWYGTVGMSYDFGNRVMLGTAGSLTRIGADYLTTLGLTVDPQRGSYTFGLEVVPRLSPNLRLGSAQGPSRFDSRFAFSD